MTYQEIHTHFATICDCDIIASNEGAHVYSNSDFHDAKCVIEESDNYSDMEICHFCTVLKTKAPAHLEDSLEVYRLFKSDIEENAMQHLQKS